MGSRSASRLVALLLLTVGLPAASEARRGWGGEAPPKGLSSGVIEHDGLSREYYFDPGRPVEAQGRPLLVVLHGGRGSAERIASYAGFGEIAGREDFVVAYPQAVDRNWNDGREVRHYRSQREEIDDVGFLAALIDSLVAEHDLDAGRVYVVGPSNGGMMAYRLALEAPEKLAAAAAVIANLPEPLAEAHASATNDPVPILIVNGTADPLMPHEGGEITFGIWGGLGRVLSTMETARFFAARGGCEGAPRSSPVEDADPGDGIEVVRRSFAGTETGCAVELYVLEGAGHTWPGGHQYAPRTLVGPATKSLDAGELVWSFFADRTR